MEERQRFNHVEMEPGSGSVSIHCPGFPTIKPEHYNFFIYIFQVLWRMQRDDFSQFYVHGSVHHKSIL